MTMTLQVGGCTEEVDTTFYEYHLDTSVKVL